MRLVLFVLILSIFVSGYSAAANAFDHVGTSIDHAHGMNDQYQNAPEKGTGDNPGKIFADMHCHHACAMQIALPILSHISFIKRSAEHEQLSASHVNLGIMLSFFRPPQTTA